MILSAQSIRKLCKDTGMITPFVEKGLKNGMTYGLSHAGYDIRIEQDITLYPNTLGNIALRSFGARRPHKALASTIESFNIPKNILFTVNDKSTWARRFLSVYNTVGEPDWKGYLTLELVYDGDEVLHIEAGSPIAQMIFYKLDEETESPYKGKYQNQVRGPVGPKEEICPKEDPLKQKQK